MHACNLGDVHMFILTFHAKNSQTTCYFTKFSIVELKIASANLKSAM